ETGRLLAASPAIALREPRNQDQAGLDSDQITAISIVFLLFVLAPMAFAWARRILLKRSAAPPPTPLLMESAERLARLEHAVDAIAIEMERVSEGQRFVTRLLTKDSAAV